MVSVSSIIAITFVLLLTLVGPIAILLIYGLRHKKQGIWSAWGLGALGFFIMQVIIRLPILSILSLSPALNFANNNYIIYALLLAFTAGLFELIGRYVVAKIMAKNLSYSRSVAAGLGHGGIEAIILVGVSYVNNLLYAFMINIGMLDSLIDQLAMSADISPYIQIKNALVGTPAYLYLFAGYERVLTVVCHLAMTLIVCYFVAKKQDIKGILLCLGMHTLLDTGAGLIPYFIPTTGANATLGYIAIYGFLTVMAVVSIFIIIRIRKRFTSIPG